MCYLTYHKKVVMWYYYSTIILQLTMLVLYIIYGPAYDDAYCFRKRHALRRSNARKR